MTLPIDEALNRFKDNEERLAKFINNPTGYTSTAGKHVESVPHFIERKEAEITASGAIGITKSNKESAQSAATAAAASQTSAQSAATAAAASQTSAQSAATAAGTARNEAVAARNEAVALAAGFASGIFGFTTKAAMLASLAHGAGSLAWVTNDSTPANNGTYIKSGASGAGTWTQASFDRVALAEGRILAIESSRGMASGKNQFDATKVVSGYEIYADGTMPVESNSSVSDLIYVKGQSYVSVSGLQSNAAIGRYYRFLAENGVTIVGTGQIAIGTNSKSAIVVPAGAFWFQFSPKQRNTSPGSYSKVQVECGNSITAFEAYGVYEVLYLGDKRIRQTPLAFVYGAGKNKFDLNACVAGYEVYSDGSIAVQANSYVSDFINVEGQSSIAISGLQSNTGFANRHYVFYAENKTSIVANGYFSGNRATITVPAGAVWFRFSPKQRTTDATNFSTTQVEYGRNASSYAAYSKTIIEINGVPIGFLQTPVAYWENAKLLAFGDSITETATVLDDGTYTEGVRSNWPKFIGAMIGANSVKSYAKSGASFREYAGQQDWQKISHQVGRAGAHGIAADIIVVAAGTNDGTANLGDYATAMAKATLNDLDRTKTIESMRWAFWSIRTIYPNADCFAVLPIQRADVESSDRQTLLDAISKIAKRYNFVVIDAHNESGIVKDFEVRNAAGRDLYDGLHPAVSGQIKMAKLISSKIKSQLS